jgi:hypothetical protein
MKFPARPKAKSRLNRGAALVVVLGLLTLLLGLVLAFLASSRTNRTTSFSSANLTAVELLTSVGVNSIIGELQTEIRDSARNHPSSPYSPPNGGDPMYFPNTPANTVPEIELPDLTLADLLPDFTTGQPSGLENLIKVSTNGGTTPTDSLSRNGRRVTAERWNKPLLMQRQATDGSNDAPPNNFPIPDWIPVARDGSLPASLADAGWDKDPSIRESVVGRYAYVVYNQGGLLDANLAGYPDAAGAPLSGSNITKPARHKTSVAYADLTIPEIGLTPDQIDSFILDWRNQATLSQPDPAAEYFKKSLASLSGFSPVHFNGISDRAFVSRQQLINFFEEKLGARDTALMDALQYFTTYSRSNNQPTFYPMQGQDTSLPNYHSDAPAVSSEFRIIQAVSSDDDYWARLDQDRGNSATGADALINPILPAVTATVAGTRIDGTSLLVGEPLMNKRFPLDRLLWLTYKGPSQLLLSANASDPLIVALLEEGVTTEHLERGTPGNIQKAFGLRWQPGPGPDGLGGYWIYDVHSSSNPIDVLETVASEGREPDFFEILKATIRAGAIGRAREGYMEYQNTSTAWKNTAFLDRIHSESYINNHILQLGANIIDQAHPENYPTHIVLPASAGTSRAHGQSFWGTVDLPYLYGSTYGCVLVATPGAPPANPDLPEPEAFNPDLPPNGYLGDINSFTGAFVQLHFPLLWNPHGERSGVASSLSPQNLRICVTLGTIALPSDIGGSIINDTAVEEFRISGRPDERGSRFDIHSDFDAVIYPDWDTNASSQSPYSSDRSEDTGVIYFGANDRTALLFDVTNPSLFRQPTPLMRPGFPAAINLRVTGDHQLNNVPLGALGTGTWGTGVPEVGSGYNYIGFYVGRFPVRFNKNSSESATIRSIQAEHTNGGFTYSLEYTPDGGSTWIPYKQIPMPIRSSGSGRDTITAPWEYNTSTGIPYEVHRTSLARRWQITQNSRRWPSADPVRYFLDPRTTRWGSDGKMPNPGFDPDPSSTNGTFYSLRPGANLGGPLTSINGDIRDGGAASKASLLLDQLQLPQGSQHWNIETTGAIGPSNHEPFYDADTVLRRTMAAWVPDTTSQNATTTIGLPLADGGASTSGTNPNRFNRPIILHRPFRSVTELSYTFSDTPWRNIDFFTPESGFTGLLDVFCVSDPSSNDSLEVGKVDLNTRQMPVLKAMLAGPIGIPSTIRIWWKFLMMMRKTWPWT